MSVRELRRNLHDTLLQGVLSASMQLHIAVEALPADSPVKPRLDRVLDLMSQVIDEGRNILRGLRTTSLQGGVELEQAFSRVPQELALQTEGSFRVVVTGKSRPLHPFVHDEVYRIGKEALVNAFHHSRAATIEMAVDYGVSRVRIAVRDNGCGIDPQLIQAGRDGHWGLQGMRERAEKLAPIFVCGPGEASEPKSN